MSFYSRLLWNFNSNISISFQFIQLQFIWYHFIIRFRSFFSVPFHSSRPYSVPFTFFQVAITFRFFFALPDYFPLRFFPFSSFPFHYYPFRSFPSRPIPFSFYKIAFLVLARVTRVDIASSKWLGGHQGVEGLQESTWATRGWTIFEKPHWWPENNTEYNNRFAFIHQVKSGLRCTIGHLVRFSVT